MRLSLTLTYAAAPATIGMMLIDEEFHRRVCAATGDARARVSVATDRDPVQVMSSRKLPTNRLPEAMRTLVGHHVTVVQTVTWPAARNDDGWSGDVVVAVDGKPVRLDATATVVAVSGGTSITYSGDLVARLPLIGSAIERGVEPVVRSALEAEQRIGIEWLAERGS